MEHKNSRKVGQVVLELLSKISVMIYEYLFFLHFYFCQEKLLTVAPGSTIFLTCSVRYNADTGFEGQAIWQGPLMILYFNTQPTHLSPKYGIRKSQSDTTTDYILEIQDISVEENGVYTCVQFNGQMDQINIQVAVQGKY